MSCACAMRMLAHADAREVGGLVGIFLKSAVSFGTLSLCASLRELFEEARMSASGAALPAAATVCELECWSGLQSTLPAACIAIDTQACLCCNLRLLILASACKVEA